MFLNVFYSLNLFELFLICSHDTSHDYESRNTTIKWTIKTYPQKMYAKCHSKLFYMVNITEQEKKHLPISSKKSNSRLKHIEIKSQKVEGMELGTNNNDDKIFGQPSIICSM
jgi:hypothetical protein